MSASAPDLITVAGNNHMILMGNSLRELKWNKTLHKFPGIIITKWAITPSKNTPLASVNFLLNEEVKKAAIGKNNKYPAVAPLKISGP